MSQPFYARLSGKGTHHLQWKIIFSLLRIRLFGRMLTLSSLKHHFGCSNVLYKFLIRDFNVFESIGHSPFPHYHWSTKWVRVC